MKQVIKQFFYWCYHSLLTNRQQIQLFSLIPSCRMFAHLQYIRELGFEPGMVIDVGAYKGQWTKYVKIIFPNCPFLMIEPQVGKESMLQKVAEKWKNVHYRMVLTGKENNVEIPFHEMETGSSIYREKTGVKSELKYHTTYTLDSLMKEYPFQGNCILKLDVQGAELDVLGGAAETLKKTEFILLEASLLNYNSGAPLVAEIVGWLNEQGFVLYDICDQQRRNKNRVLVQADFLFSRCDGVIRQSINFK